MSSELYFTAEQLKAALAQMHRITAAAKKATKNNKLPVNVLAATHSELYSAVNKLFAKHSLGPGSQTLRKQARPLPP